MLLVCVNVYKGSEKLRKAVLTMKMLGFGNNGIQTIPHGMPLVVAHIEGSVALQ